MNCIEARKELERLAAAAPPEGELAEHLGQCELCRAHYDDAVLMRTLADLEVPEPSAEFIDRALAHATVAPQPAARRVWPVALAASVLVAVTAVLLPWDQAPGEPAIEVAEQELPAPVLPPPHREEIRIVINSSRAHENAELSVELEGLELEGYAGHQRLAWNTALKQGANLLVLPVLLHDAAGALRVVSKFGDTTREVDVQVARQTPAVLEPGPSAPSAPSAMQQRDPFAPIQV